MTIPTRFKSFVAATFSALLLIPSCTESDSGNSDAGSGNSSAGTQAGGAPEGGAEAEQGGVGGVTSAGGISAPADAGSGGASECIVLECEGLPEEDCKAAASVEQGGCLPAYGRPWPDGEPSQYLGCSTRCCGDDCEVPPLTEICAHPSSDPGSCWLLNSPPPPDGWVECADLSQCSE
jgi:hypothetical protein